MLYILKKHQVLCISLSIKIKRSRTTKLQIFLGNRDYFLHFKKEKYFKFWSLDTWVAQWFSVCLQLRAWSWSPGIESHIGLPAWSLLLPLPVSLPLSISLSWINKGWQAPNLTPSGATLCLPPSSALLGPTTFPQRIHLFVSLGEHFHLLLLLSTCSTPTPSWLIVLFLISWRK